MSDHMDAPGADANPRCDIGDIFAFKGETGLCLIMSVNPLTAPADTEGLRLDPGAVYEFKFDIDGDAIPELAYRVVVAGSGPRQQITLLRAVGDEAKLYNGSGEVILTGLTSAGAAVDVLRGPSGEMLYVGPRQDPFFFNFVGVDSPLADTFRAAISQDGLPNQGTSANTFAPTNITAIVLEVPMEHEKFTTWGVTTLEGHRIDRAGRPSVSAIFLPSPPYGGLRDAFNASNPDEDLDRFGDVFRATLRRYKADENLANRFLPDVLPIDLSQPTVYPNGRGLTEDPVYDQILVVNPGATGGSGSHVNPLPFTPAFPYLTPPVGDRPGWTPPPTTA